jgi:hypothetical protein
MAGQVALQVRKVNTVAFKKYHESGIVFGYLCSYFSSIISSALVRVRNQRKPSCVSPRN